MSKEPSYYVRVLTDGSLVTFTPGDHFHIATLAQDTQWGRDLMWAMDEVDVEPLISGCLVNVSDENFQFIVQYRYRKERFYIRKETP